MNDDEVQRLTRERAQYQMALSSVLECFDRVSADPRSVVRWTSTELMVIGAARSLVPVVAPEIPELPPTT